MRLVLFLNGRVGLEALQMLKRKGSDLAGIVVHPNEKARHRDEIIAASGLAPENVIDAPELRTQIGLDWLRSLNAELGLSAYFGYILKQDVLSIIPRGILNVHPAYLPFNRGSFTNVWSIVDSAPAGVSIHYIDTGIDSGDIVARKRVDVSIRDTGLSLYRKLEDACLDLLDETWPEITSGALNPVPQSGTEGSSHKMKDVEAIDRIELDRQYRAGDLIDIIRARTFFPYAGAYFEFQGERVYLRLQLLTEDELSGDCGSNINCKEH